MKTPSCVSKLYFDLATVYSVFSKILYSARFNSVNIYTVYVLTIIFITLLVILLWYQTHSHALKHMHGMRLFHDGFIWQGP